MHRGFPPLSTLHHHLLSMAIIYSMLSLISGALLDGTTGKTSSVPGVHQPSPGVQDALGVQRQEGELKLHIELSPPQVQHVSVLRWVVINCSASAAAVMPNTVSSSSSSPTAHQAQMAPVYNPDDDNDHDDDVDDDGAVDAEGSTTLQYIHTNNNNNSIPPDTSTTRGYTVTVTSQNANVAVPYTDDEWGQEENENRTDRISLHLPYNQHSVFAIRARNVGHVVFFIQVNTITSSTTGSSEDSNNSIVSLMEYPVTVIRKLRLVDLVFDCAMATIALLNSFSLGCLTQWSSLRKHLRREPTALLLTACSHFIIMPMAAIALVKVFGMERDVGLGLFYVACIPGGGGGLVMVAITQSGDRGLSISSNVISTFLAVGTAPLWMFGLSRVLSSALDLAIHLVNVEIWLAASAGAYLLGILARLCSEKATEAYLNWFAKPFLLLFCILFITLGVYINIYVFNILSTATMIGGGLLPLLGYCLGLLLSYLGRLDGEYAQTVATECTVCNCLLALVLARFCLPPPASDLAAAMPLWVVFTSPVPFILASVGRRIRDAIARRCQKRREKKYRHFSIVSSLVNVPDGGGGTLADSNKLNDQTTAEEEVESSHATAATVGFLLVDEKVTVL